MLLFTFGELIEVEEVGEGSGFFDREVWFLRIFLLKLEIIFDLDSSWLAMVERRGFSRLG